MKRIHGTCLLTLLVLASCTLPGTAWQIETVERFTGWEVGWGGGITMALDAAGLPHLIYEVRHQTVESIDWPYAWHYAFHDGRAWQIGRARVGRSRPSLVVGQDGTPMIAAGGYAVSYGRYIEDNWHQVTIVHADYSSYHTSLALDLEGQSHLAYLEARSGVLEYASQEDAWSPETVDPGFEAISTDVSGRGGGVSLALDRADRPHIGYCAAQSYYRCTLKYAYGEGSTWSIVPVDDNVYAARIFLVLDAADQPHLCYHAQGELRYAYKDETGWQIEPFARVSGTLGDHAMALDPWGRPHVSYYDNGDLMYAWRDENGLWYKEAIDAVGDMGRLNALAVDSAGRVHVAYSDETNQALKYARRVPGIKLLPAVVLAGLGLFLIASGLTARHLLRRAGKGR